MSSELLYQIALTLIPTIGPVQAQILLQHYNVREIFSARTSALEKIQGIGTIRARAIRNFNDFRLAETEIAFIAKHNITPLFITDPNYPKRLLNCYDSPVLLFYKGTTDLNAQRMIAIVGTRMYTDYGKMVTEKLLKDLADQQIIVVSGLAHGIDAIAHRAALQQFIPTIGVLAHGLDSIYPSQHKTLARDMLHNGGLLTEYRSGTSPDRHNFPARNRIVAGICDTTIVIQTGARGGSMITAEQANQYNRDVFAVPGRLNDPKSEGCNELIRSNKAILLNDSRHLMEFMGWELSPVAATPRQASMFAELLPDEQQLITILKEKDHMHIDELNFRSGLSNGAVAAAILGLELNGLIHSKPGKLYGISG